MPTTIHELKGVMTAESRGLADALTSVISMAGRAASAWETASTRITVAVSGIENAVTRSVASFDRMGAAATNNAAQVVAAASSIRSAWAGAIAGLGGKLPTITPGGAGPAAGGSAADRLAERQAASAQRQADQAANLANRVAVAQQTASDRAAAAANRASVEADRAASAQQRAAERTAAANDRAAERASIAAHRSSAAWSTASARMMLDAHKVGAAWLDAFDKMLSAATRVSVVVGGVITAIGGTVIGVGTKFNDTITRADIALTKLTGSGNVSKAMLAELQQLAIESPSFKFGDLAPLAVQLINAKFAAKDVVPLIRLIGDQVAAIGGDQSKFDRIVLAITQIQQKGRFMSQEANQLAEAGISPWAAIAAQTGRAIAEVRAMTERGQISSAMAIKAIMADMAASAGAMKATATATVGGLLGSMTDLFEQWAGRVTKPIYDVMRNSLAGLVESLQGGAFADFTAMAQVQFARLATAIQNALATLGGGADPWAAAAGGLRTFTTLVIDAINAFVRLTPTLIELGQTVASVIGWFARFAIEHPNWLAALVALKVAGMLGLTSALGSLITALGSTIVWLGQLATGASKASDAMAAAGKTSTAWKTSLLALVAVGTALWITDATTAIKELNDAITRSIELSQKLQTAQSKKVNADIKRAVIEEKPGDAAANLAAMEQRAKADVEAATKKTLDAQDAVTAATARTDLNAKGRRVAGAFGLGLSPEAEAQKALEQEQKILESAKERLQLIQQAIAEDKAATEAAAGHEDMNARPAPLGDQEAIDAAKTKEAMDAMIRKAEQARLQKSGPAFDEMQAAMTAGAAPEDLERLMRELPGFTDKLIADTLAKYEIQRDEQAVNQDFDSLSVEAAAAAATNVKDESDRTETAKREKADFKTREEAAQVAGVDPQAIADATAQFTSLTLALETGAMKVDDYKKNIDDVEKRLSLATSTDPSRFSEQTTALGAAGINTDGITARFTELQRSLVAGTITIDQYKNGIKTVEAEVQAATQAQSTFHNMLRETGANLPTAATQQLKAEFQRLQEALLNGKIGVDEFNGGMRRLADDAKQKDLERRASGQFTEGEFNTAILERIAGIQGQQFGQRVDDQVAEMMLQAGMSMETVAKLMGKLPDKYQKAFDAQKARDEAFKNNDWKAWGERTALFNNWSNSIQGQATLLRNQIASMSQNLTLGILDTARERERYVKQIAALNGQLNQLLAPRTPIVRETEATFLRDPNLPQQQQGNTVIQVTLPMVRPDSAAVAYEIGEAVAREQQRRGKAAFN